MSSALMSDGFFSSSSVSDVSTGGFFKSMSSDFSDFSSLLSMSLVVVPNASFLSEYSRRCCFTEIFANDDFPKSMSLLLWYRSPVGKSILTGCSIDNILCFFICDVIDFEDVRQSKIRRFYLPLTLCLFFDL